MTTRNFASESGGSPMGFGYDLAFSRNIPVVGAGPIGHCLV